MAGKYHITYKDVDRLIALRKKAIAGDKDAEEQYNDLAFIFSTVKKIDLSYFNRFLSTPKIGEEIFRYGVGYPELDLVDLLFKYLDEGLRSRRHTADTAKPMKSVLLHFIDWLDRVQIHANDITAPIFDQFIDDENIQADYPASRIKHFWKWLEINEGISLYPSIRYLNPKKIKKPINYYRIFFTPSKEIEKTQLGIREFPAEGWLKIDDTWFYSEVNLIFNVIYRNYEQFDDWRRLEILLRILRETGLRWVHWHHLMWSDIIYEAKVPKIIYDRLRTGRDEKGDSIVQSGKLLPTLNAPISPLLAKRIKDYRTKWGPKEPDNSYICQFKLSTSEKLTPRLEYHDFRVSRNMSHIFNRIRLFGGFQYCRPPIRLGDKVKVRGKWYDVIKQNHPKNITISVDNIEQLVVYPDVEDVIRIPYRWAAREKVGVEEDTDLDFDEIGRISTGRLYLPTQDIMPFCPYMFRYSYGTLIGNVLEDTETMGAYFGDRPDTLKLNYRAPGLREYYKAIGIKTYQDILVNVFSNEGLYEGELPSARLKPGRKPKGFKVQPITPSFSDSKLWK